MFAFDPDGTLNRNDSHSTTGRAYDSENRTVTEIIGGHTVVREYDVLGKRTMRGSGQDIKVLKLRALAHHRGFWKPLASA
jgi:hypothetical protein